MSTISLYNASWTNGVIIDVTKGNYQDCQQNAPYATQTVVAYQQSFDVPGDNEIVCYRRDLDPDNPNGQMTNWTSIADLGQDQTVNI